MPGSLSNPVSLDPFRTIVEVGWPGAWYRNYSGKIQPTSSGITACSPGTHTGTAPANFSAVYIATVQWQAVIQGNGAGTLLNARSAQTKTGTFFGGPTTGPAIPIGAWTGIFDAGTMRDRAVISAGTSVRFSYEAAQPGETRCYTGLPVAGRFSEIGSNQEIYATQIDYGACSFIDTNTGDEYAAYKIQNLTEHVGAGAPEPGSWEYRVFFRKL